MSTVNQAEFISAVMNPDQTVPDGLRDDGDGPAGKRFSVYRNNVAVSLTEALITAFPVVHKLVGDDFFRAMSGVYLRQHPPSSPLMMFYGAEFPTFLENFEPAQQIPYLPDIARVELALRHAYHAADAAGIDPQVLQDFPPDTLMQSQLQLAPAVTVIRSKWPVFSIYRANTQPDAPKPVMQAEDVLIARPEFDPVVEPLAHGGGVFTAGLAAGDTFGAAFDAASHIDGFDLSQTLGLLLGTQAITHVTREGTT